jgi:hypothetical protein
MDLYDLLSVSRTATEREIKRAYLKQKNFIQIEIQVINKQKNHLKKSIKRMLFYQINSNENNMINMAMKVLNIISYSSHCQFHISENYFSINLFYRFCSFTD